MTFKDEVNEALAEARGDKALAVARWDIQCLVQAISISERQKDHAQAERDKLKAVEAERLAAEEEQRAKAADEDHRKEIRRELEYNLDLYSNDNGRGELFISVTELIDLIDEGKIQHVTINY